jgi:ubiquinone/menaquinone biosynthesis C-methylase UbiE
MARVNDPAPAGPAVHHPIFARLWSALSRFGDEGFARYRAELLSGLHGRVLEIGAGNGLNFAHYPSTVTEVVAVEPEPFLRTKAQAAAAAAPVLVSVIDGQAEALPCADGSFDAAVSCLVLCSVSDQRQVLAELHRVLAPGGQLRFLEHVRSGSPRMAAIQRGLDRSGAWPLIGGGCHCSRETLTSIAQSRLVIEDQREKVFPPAWLPVNPIVIGTARAPG